MNIDNKKVAILGGGAIALATAVDFINSGFKVNIFEIPSFKKSIQPIIENGEVGYSGQGGSGVVKLNLVTTDIKEALKDVGLIIMVAPAFAHDIFVETCLPYLQDDQVFFVETAYFACLRYADAIKKTGKKVILAEMNSTPYATRKTSPNQVFFNVKRKELFIAALPAKNTREVINLLHDAWPTATPAKNVLQTSFDLANWMIHPPVTLIHKGLIEHSSEYSLPVKDSIPPSVISLMEAMEKERLELGKAYNINLLPIKHFWETGGDTIKESLQRSKEFETYNFEYTNGSHQYLTEDFYYGLPPLLSFASLAGVSMPTISALLHIFSVIDGVDYLGEGLNIKKLGLSGLNVKDILRIAEEGV